MIDVPKFPAHNAGIAPHLAVVRQWTGVCELFRSAAYDTSGFSPCSLCDPVVIFHHRGTEATESFEGRLPRGADFFP